MKILLVDPDEYYHHQFRQKFSPEFTLLVAKTSEEAALVAADHSPDMVVSELLLPDGPSFETLKLLRRSSETSVPVVVYSQIANLEDIEHTLGLGVSGYFVKGQDSIHDVYQLLLSLNNQ